LFVQTLKRI